MEVTMPLPRWEVMRAIATGRVVGIVRADDRVSAVRTARQLFAAGIAVVEVSLTTPGALDAIAELADGVPAGGVLGAGTVLDAPAARAALTAGARLLVSPTLDIEVLRTGLRSGAAVLPGCATPTEMLTALAAGADAVKLFPASTWRPADLAAVRQALPQLPVVPTGGITADNAGEWLAAGAVAVGVGGALTRDGGASARAFLTAIRLGEPAVHGDTA
jgi:2-dehydro-3-deoxyphosphogluconate aldolase/(4S)-4-hydroxy-2-oxoglutarate aldolase